MKKVLLASLLLLTAVSVDVMARGHGGKGGKDGNAKHERPEMKYDANGCLEVPTDAKGPMKNVTEADTDGNGCVTKDEFETYMKNKKPEGKPHHGKGNRPEKTAE